ncbi:MAG: hypothetical protein ACQEXB_08690 [Bacillota bacterium]
MNRKCSISVMSSLLAVSLLTACNTDNNENKMTEIKQVDDGPVESYEDTKQNRYFKYNHDIPTKESGTENPNRANNEKVRTRGNKPLEHNKSPDQTNMWMEKGRDHEFDDNRGAE